MPRVCGNCKYVTEDLFANNCPLCQRPLALSSRVGSLGEEPRHGVFSRRNLIILAVVLLIGVPLAAISSIFMFPTYCLEAAGEVDSLGAIRVGMPVREVCKALDIEAPPRAFSGTITWGRGGRMLRIRFTDGKVVAIEEGSLPFAVTVTKVQAKNAGRRT
jgi:hypothetical protein